MLPRLATAALALALTAQKAPPPADAEGQVLGAVEQAYRAARQTPPTLDTPLSAAAAALARRGLSQGAHAATDTEAVTDELSRAEAWDPPPRAIAVRSSPPERAVESVLARTDLASMPATRVGVGYAKDGDSGAVVLLLCERKALLEDFPRQVSPGQAAMLRGDVVFPLYDAQVYVTLPNKAVQRPAPYQTEARNRFAARIYFPDAGRYTVEVVAQSAKGPQVAAMFRVQAGAAGQAARVAAVEPEPERDDLAKAEDQVLISLNARRKAAGLKPLARSSLLDTVASEHCQEMARLNYFAHVSPVSGDVTQRLKSAGFHYRRVGENLGEAETALEAHRAIESSPGHLANILDPEVDLVGLGTARARRGAIDNVLLTEVFARAAP